MKTFHEKLQIEFNELNKKIVKLEALMTSGRIKELEETETWLLEEQLDAMKEYSRCLYNRLMKDS